MKQKQAFEVITDIAEENDALIIADIGSQSLWLKEVKDRPENMYLSGPMGTASSMALGVATAHKDRAVIAACGDGALAMNMTSLVTISNTAPKNLTIIVMDNGVYEFTKSLPVPSRGINWRTISEVYSGFQSTVSLSDMNKLDLKNGPHFVHAEIEPGELPPGPGMHAIDAHHRFKALCQGN